MRFNGLAGPIARAALSPLSALYGRALEARAGLYRSGSFASRRAACPVISVGNLTFGGTGKTPFVEFLARRLRFEGKRPSILSRGYGRRSKGVIVVSRGEGPLVGPDEGGDEPVAIAKRLPAVPVVAAERRVEGAQAAIELGTDVILLHDGYQHLALDRDVNRGRTAAAVRTSARTSLGARPRGCGRLHPREPRRSLSDGPRRARPVESGRSDLLRADPRRRAPGRAGSGGTLRAAVGEAVRRGLRDRQPRFLHGHARGARSLRRRSPRVSRPSPLHETGPRAHPPRRGPNRQRVDPDHGERLREARRKDASAGRHGAARRRGGGTGILSLPALPNFG
ncbi:MAG: tetraacyldisaccharide 4'-kinase [Acidobacteria bacterium]|nr:MAG: tetraacyldisaccharide 4'-kinase [Acidobacteriota bacterium]